MKKENTCPIDYDIDNCSSKEYGLDCVACVHWETKTGNRLIVKEHTIKQDLECLKQEIAIRLTEVVNGYIGRIEGKNVNPNLLVELIQNTFNIEFEDEDYNGWQCDYWYSFSIKGIMYELCGSAYYGTFSFSVCEEE